MCVGHNNNRVVKRDVNKKKPYETQHICMFIIEMLRIRCLLKEENLSRKYLHANIYKYNREKLFKIECYDI